MARQLRWEYAGAIRLRRGYGGTGRGEDIELKTTSAAPASSYLPLDQPSNQSQEFPLGLVVMGNNWIDAKSPVS